VSSGTLQIGAGSTAGDLSGTSGVSVSSGATLAFNRSDAYSFAKVVSGAGAVTQSGSGVTTLSGANTYTGATSINGGSVVYGSASGIPAGSAVTAASGTTLNINGRTDVTRSANTTINGTLALGTNGAINLTAGIHSIAAITGSGTITVSTGATLTLTGAISNTSVNITLAGGTLNTGSFTHSLGAVSATDNSTLDLGSSGSANVTVASLDVTTGKTLTVANWLAGSRRVYATAVVGSPARSTANVAPLNRIQLASNAATLTQWASGAPGELVLGALTFWDTTPNNGAVDGGTGTWDGSTSNWTTSTGTANGLWAGGTNTATFQGTAGTVTVSGTQSFGGLTFGATGYTITGGAALSLAQDATIATPSGGNATLSTPITGTNAVTFTTGTAIVGATHTYSGATTVSSGTLQIGAGSTAGDLSGTSGVSVSSGATLAFNRSDAYSFAKAISGAGAVTQSGSGTTTLSGTNTYTGATTVSAGTLTYGAAAGVPAGSAVTVSSGATLNINSRTDVTRSANTTVAGTLALGTNGAINLTAGLHSIAAITGSGTITVSTGATLTLTGAISNTSVNITLAGGTLNTGSFTHSLGAMSATDNSTLDLGSSGSASVTVASLDVTTGKTLTVANWLAGSRRIYATAVVGAPARNTANVAPLNRIQLATNAAALTQWASGTPGELLLGSLTYWDTTPNNGAVDGGTGTWDTSTANWTSSSGAANGLWAGGTSVAIFQGTAGTVTVSGTQSFGGLTFGTAGYTIGGGTALSLAQDATITLPSTSSATAINTPLSGSFNVTFTGGWVNLQGTHTYTGVTAITGNAKVQIKGGDLSGTSGVSVAAGAQLAVDRGDVYTFSKSISGAGDFYKWGSGATTLSGANTYTGVTSINSGSVVYGSATGIPAASVVTVSGSATLNLNGRTDVTRSANTTVSGTLALGTNGAVNLTAGTHSIAAITGSGTITVGSGATLTLTGAISNTNVNITLAGGTFNTGSFTHSVGTMSATDNSTLNLGNSGSASLTVATLDVASGKTLAVSNWLSGTRRLYAAAVNGAPSRDAPAQAPLNRITLASNIASVTQWASGSPGEINLAAPRVRISQLSNAGIGTFNFVMSGLDTSTTQLTTTTAGTAVTSTAFVGTAGTASTVVQTPPGSWPSQPVSISCLDANGSANGNGTGSVGTVSGAAVSLTASQMRAGADLTCTFTNTNNGISGVVFNDGGAPSGGANTGIPNDGLRNGSEAGVAGVTVTLTNCGSTTYATALTDAGGAYSLAVPTAQVGQNVCVAASLPASAIATGANAGGTALPNGSATTVGGKAYTYTRSSHQVAFSAAAPGLSTINFGQVPASTLTPATSTKLVQPGVNAVHSHIFTAGTAGTLQLQLGTAAATPAIGGWDAIVYQDSGCKQTAQANAQRLAPSGLTVNVLQGDQVCFLVQQAVPIGAAAGNTNVQPVTATLTFSNAAPALSASYSVTDTTTASAASVTLLKEVRNVTQGGSFGTVNQAKSGDVLEYRITYANNATTAVNAFVVNDSTPTYTTFVSAAAGTTPSGLSSCTKETPANPSPAPAVACATAQTAGGTGLLSWRFAGSLAGGATGSVLYQVKVD
jgi:fibronectin-binding autotransporter adhesin